MGTLSLSDIRLTLKASCTVVNDFAGGTAVTKTNPLLSLIPTLTSGTGADQADLAWFKEGGALNNNAVLLDVYDGANFDGTESAGETGGKAQTMAEAILIVVINRDTSAAEMQVGGNVTSDVTIWRNPFGAFDNAALRVTVGGALVMFAPAASAYTITDTSDHLLNVTCASTCTYDVLVLGRSA